MSPHRVQLRFLTTAMLGVAFVPGCSTDYPGSGAQRAIGMWNQGIDADNGLGLSASPATILIDPADSSTPTDANRGGEQCVEIDLLMLATAEDGTSQPGLDITFTTSAGVLASAGAPVKTDAEGWAADRLRVYASDLGSIQVSVSDGIRVTTIVVTRVVSEPPVANTGPDQTVGAFERGTRVKARVVVRHDQGKS